MSLPVVSLAALLLAIVLSFSSRLNVGIPALGLAWLLGALTPGSKSEALATAFPASLFLTLLGVTLLFAAAESNGTLVRLAERAVALVGGDRRLVPWMLFLLAGAVSAVGPGACPPWPSSPPSPRPSERAWACPPSSWPSAWPTGPTPATCRP